jgi:hypothetical protein
MPFDSFGLSIPFTFNNILTSENLGSVLSHCDSKNYGVLVLSVGFIPKKEAEFWIFHNSLS